MTRKRCLDCAFSDPIRPLFDAQYPSNYCRRHAPRLHTHEIGAWPVVKDDDWCGEWRADADAPPDKP